METVALVFDLLNGLHDAANSVATVVSTRLMRPRVGATRPNPRQRARSLRLPTSRRARVAVGWQRIRGRHVIRKGSGDHMTRIVVIVGVALLLVTNRSWAQSEANCDQIRQAIAQYGYAAARAHALANYGAEAVTTSEKQCMIAEASVKEVPAKPAAKHHAKKKKHIAPTAEAQRK
jgi:hypothetical protein